MRDIDVVEAILKLCGVEHRRINDRSGRPFWLSSVDVPTNLGHWRRTDDPHWHVKFDSEGNYLRHDIGKPCTECRC